MSLIYVYGILKRGHALDLTHMGGKFIDEDSVYGNLYRIGHGVGLKLDRGKTDNLAHGEVWEIPDTLWKHLDDIESEGYAYARVEATTLKGHRVQLYEHIYYPDEMYGTGLPKIEKGVF